MREIILLLGVLLLMVLYVRHLFKYPLDFKNYYHRTNLVDKQAESNR